jgi:hypothetical protein
MTKATIRPTRKNAALALVLALLATLAFAASAQALPAKFWGVVPQTSSSEEHFERLAKGGVESVRVSLGWADLQPQRDGSIQWGGVDSLVERAALAGLDVLPTISGAPTWAVPIARVQGGGGAKAPAHLPVSGAAAGGWRSLLIQAVERYGPDGQFWATHPSVPVKPIRSWQIWNEPNFKFFVARPNPAEYGKLVKLSYSALKAADPGAQLVLAGLFSQPLGGRFIRVEGKKKKLLHRTSINYFASYFLEQMYKSNPGIKSKFSAVALHPYTETWRYLTPEIEEVRSVLTASHDAAKALWITELGWSSGPRRSDDAFAKGPAGQAAELRGAFRLLTAKAAAWRIKRLYWFSVEDAKGYCNFCDGTGLFTEAFQPKKSWFEYVKFAGGTR